MSFITDIRTHYQISQQDLAAYLELPRTTLAMAENDQRPLSIWGVDKLYRMEPWTMQPTTEEMQQEINAIEKSLQAEQLKKDQQLLKNKQWLLANSQKKMEKMQSQKMYALRILQWCSHEFLFPAHMPQPSSGLNKIYYEARQQLAANGTTAQSLLADKISLIEKEIALIAQRLVAGQTLDNTE
jgi:transcriptional regulator with XRE-family HTH domain